MQKENHPLLDYSPTGGLIGPLPVEGRPLRSYSRLSPALSYILAEVRREIGIRGEQAGLNDDGAGVREELVRRVAGRLGFELNNCERDELLAELEEESRPFGVLQRLVDDLHVSDIIVTDFAKVTVRQGRKNFSTDAAFESQEAYEGYVERLLQQAGTSYSTRKPIADGMIGSYARIHAVHRSLCESGPYLTIRINRFASISLEHLAGAGLAPQAILEYLRIIVRAGRTVLIVGEVGTGKTTLVRALASSLPVDESILVIEDTPEIRLEHPHVRYLTTREANSDGAGRVSSSECIRAGMRMAMNRIIFGEMRDAEAAESFIDVCASGHPGLSTIHARSAQEAIARLELFLGRAQRGAAQQVLAEQVVTAVQVIVHVDICRVTGKRRVMEVREIGPVADGRIRQREVFRYCMRGGELPAWQIVLRASAHRDDLEQCEDGICLSGLPGQLELAPEVLYREAAYLRAA